MSGVIKSIGGAIGSLLGVPPAAAAGGGLPPPPVAEPPKPMPTVDTAAVAEARRKAIATQQARGGRMSTFLSGAGSPGGSDKLGA